MSKKSQFGMTLLLSTIIVGGANASTVSTSNTLGATMIAQQGAVCKGVVKDATGEPIIGASVSVKGTKNATVTDLDGNFTLSGVSKGTTIVISYIGCVNSEIKWDGKSLDVTLAEDTHGLEEVVVVGYGTQKKVNLSGAVANVDGKVLENRPITNIGQGLQGVVPNLNVSMNSGGAPGASSSYNIRGNTSLNGGSPLVLVDNVQMDANLVNPEDVESISVLKDASSAAIYGARAAYGVILITTTKKGRKSDKPTISFNATGYWQSPAKSYHNVNSMQYLKMMDEANKNDGGSGRYFKDQVYKYTEAYFNGTYDQPVFFDENYDTAKYGYCGNTDWWNELYKTSFSQIYNASISGGNDRTTYYASLGMNNQKGILTAGDDKYKKYNANVNISSNITKWLNVSAKITHTYTSELHPTGGTTAMNPTAYSGLSAYSGKMKNDLSPLMPVKHPDGHYAGQGSYTNPIAIMEQGGNAKYRQNDLWMTGAVRITPIKGLVINADYTWNFYGRNSSEHVRNFYDYTAVPGTEKYYPWTNPSSITVSNYDDYYQAFNVFAEYSLSLAEKHNFKVLVGYNQEKKHNKYHWVGRKNLIDNDTPQINLAYGDTSTSGSESMWATNGLFFRFNYDFMGKYLFEFNGREDGSSKFAKGNRYAFFPSGSVAWRVSEEKFFEPLRSWWDNLKIRGSYGSLGNQNVSGNFPYLATYGVSTKAGVLLGGTRPVAVYAPGLVSSSFTWETVNQLDLGIDATWLNNRLSASFDWYRRDTKDMLTRGATLPSVLGTSVPRSNAANMKTTGWEVSVEWNDRLSCGLGYHIKGVLSDYQSEITKYSNDARLLGDHYVGEKLGEIWGLVSNGLFKSDEEAASWDQSAVSGGHWSAGDVKFEDLNGNNKIDWGEGTVDKPGDRKILGNSTPRYAYGITAGADYKGFDFEMFWQGIGKRDYFGGWGGAQFWGFTDEWGTPQTTALDYWTKENPNAYFPKLHHYGVNGGNHSTSSRYMLNAAYLRLKNVTLGYTVPSSLLKKVGIARLRVFVQGENLLTLTPMKVKFADPETLGNMTYPINKKISVGMNLTL